MKVCFYRLSCDWVISMVLEGCGVMSLERVSRLMLTRLRKTVAWSCSLSLICCIVTGVNWVLEGQHLVAAVNHLRHLYLRDCRPIPRWMTRVRCQRVPRETSLVERQLIAGSSARLYTPLAWVVKEKVEAGDWGPLSRRDWLCKVVARSQETAVCCPLLSGTHPAPL